MNTLQSFATQGTMLGLVYTGPGQIMLQNMPLPLRKAGEAIIKIESVGICGSDMHAFHGHDERRPPPLVLGHEAAGIVIEGTHLGQRVAINPLVTCGHCDMCSRGRSQLCAERQIISMPPRAGAFAEYMCIPERNLVNIPDDMEFSVAALAEPLAVSWHAVRIGAEHLHGPLAQAKVCVLGGGAIGVGAALTFGLFGAREIWLGEPQEVRRVTAAAAGDIHTYTPGTAEEPATGSIDIVIDAVGAMATRAAASRMVKPGGVIVHVGLLPGHEGLDVRRITLQEICLIGSYCYSAADFQNVVDCLAIGRFGSLNWVSRVPFSDGVAAFTALDKMQTAAAKIVLEFTPQDKLA
jgi:threonine dehydrogenase-like Zn-dependent dehydrogenase